MVLKEKACWPTDLDAVPPRLNCARTNRDPAQLALQHSLTHTHALLSTHSHALFCFQRRSGVVIAPPKSEPCNAVASVTSQQRRSVQRRVKALLFMFSWSGKDLFFSSSSPAAAAAAAIRKGTPGCRLPPDLPVLPDRPLSTTSYLSLRNIVAKGILLLLLFSADSAIL